MLRLTHFEVGDDSLQAGYACLCGCTPSVIHDRGGALARSTCCCGNAFAVGPAAEASLSPRDGFELQTEPREAWGTPITAAWLVGPSVHPQPAGGEEHDRHEHDHDGPASAVDPVCGMTVDPAVATGKGLHRENKGVGYYFCGKGCYLDFGDDPERILDLSYIPSM